MSTPYWDNDDDDRLSPQRQRHGNTMKTYIILHVQSILKLCNSNLYICRIQWTFLKIEVCVFHQATCTCYKLPFNLNAFKSILNIIEVVFFFTFRSGLWKPQFEIFIITLCRKLFQYNDRHVGGGLTHSETKEKNNNWEMSFSRGSSERCNIDNLLFY